MVNKKNILLVEDNPDDAALTIRALKKGNIVNKIEVARDGEEALDYLCISDIKKDTILDINIIPELVILDLKLPKVDGIEVLKKIRSNERTKLLPVIILTSSEEEKDLVDSYSFGANSYIKKPVDFKQFIRAAAQLKMYWLVLNESPPERL
jgi:two-component system response regulator